MKILWRILITLSFVFNLAFLFYGFHFVWSTKYRAESNHGINFPETTKVKSCRGSVFNIEGHTTTYLQFHPIQLNEFMSQLEIISKKGDSTSGREIQVLYCVPPIGDNLIIRLEENSSWVNLQVDTDWN